MEKFSIGKFPLDKTKLDKPKLGDIFFDHFLGDTLNLKKWVLREGDVTLSDSQLILTGTSGTRGRIDGLKQFKPKADIRARSRCSLGDYIQLISLRDGIAFDNSIILYYWQSWRFRTENPNGAFEQVGVPIATPTEFHEYKIIWELGKATLYQDGIQKAQNTSNVPIAPLVYYYRESSTVNGDVYVDWVSIKK